MDSRVSERDPRSWTAVERRALSAIAVQFFVNGAVVASYVPRLPGIRDRLDVSLTAIGFIIAVATTGGVLGSAIVGRAVDRWGTRSVMLGGALVLVGLLPLVGFAASPWHLLVVLAAISIADVLTDVAMNIQGSRLSARRSVPVMNRLHGMWSIGTVVGGLIAAAMAALEVDLRVHLIGASVVLVAALLYVAPGLLRHDEPAHDAIDRSSAGGPARSVLVFGILGAVAIVPEMVNSDWAAFRLTDDLDASKGVAGLAFVAFTTGMVTGRLFGDGVVVRIGGRAALRRAALLAIGGTAIATLVPWIPSVFLGLYVAGLGVSVIFPELYDSAARSRQSARSLGALTAGTRIALFAAPALVGLLAGENVFTVGAAVAITTIPSIVAVLVLSNRP